LILASLGADKPLIEDYVKANVGPIPSDLTLDPFYKTLFQNPRFWLFV
jgi:hypothetical protein